MTIRLATAADLNDLTDMLGALFDIEFDFDPDPVFQRRGLELMLESPDRTPIWVMTDAGRVMGMCTMQTLVSTACGAAVGLIEDVFVQPEFRRRGIGRALLNHACEWAREQGLARLQLLCDLDNAPALDFYDRLGWARTNLVGIRKLV